MKFQNILELWRSRSIVLTVLSIFLGSFFMLMGSLKIGPWISPEIHRELRRNYIHFAKLMPLITSLFGYRVPPKIYRLIWGWLEMSSGFILVLVPLPRIKIIANGLLLILTIFSIFNHYQAGHKFDRIAPCIVFTLMLACRLIVEYQVYRRDLMASMVHHHSKQYAHQPLADHKPGNHFQYDQIKTTNNENHSKID